MNYFEFYNIPVSFYPDLSTIKKAYFNKSKELHPDFFTNASEEEQSHALQQSSYNNIAYKTLVNKDQRFAYILKLENQIVEGEKEVLPQEFLFEMMEINEEIESVIESKDSGKLQSLKKNIGDLKVSLANTIEPLLQSYPNIEESEMKTIKDYHFKSKYINRISERLL